MNPMIITASKRVPKIATNKNKEARYMPIRLKAVLVDNRIKQSEWAAAIKQEGGRGKGKGLSEPAASLLLNYGTWPRTTNPETIKSQTVTFLTERGVTPFELKNIWSELVEGEMKSYERAAYANPNTDEPVKETTIPETEMLTPTAKKHFGLFRDPFTDDVQDSNDVFLDVNQRYIREAMYQTAKHGGFLAVIGESGAGKTTLRRDLIDRIQKEDTDIAVIQPQIIDKGRLTAGAICDAIICDISKESPKRSQEAKSRQILRLLTNASRGGASHVLMIEEAHDLSVQTLKYLKRFWELEDGFRKLLSIILIGQPELKASLDERQNWEAREVIRRCEIAELQPLNGNLEDYLALKLKRMNKRLDDVFDKDSFDAIRQRLIVQKRGHPKPISMLYPLVVNITVTKAMNMAASFGAPKVNAEIVEGV